MLNNNLQRIWVDFHNTDRYDRLRLNCVGTIEDLAFKGITLQEGLQLIFYQEDVEVIGKVEYSKSENLWTAKLINNAIRFS